jgi:hypothetical protein
MSKDTKKRKDTPRSFRFDNETNRLIGRLCKVMRDPATGAERSATDVLRLGVRVLAREHLPGETPEKKS